VDRPAGPKATFQPITVWYLHRELERMQSDRAHTTPMPPITLVGNGRVGGSLARSLRAAGVRVALTGREGIGSHPAEVVLLCVPDAEVANACEAAADAPGLRFVGHTSGAITLDALEPARTAGAETFSMHPMQTIPDAGADLTAAPAAIAGSTPAASEVARRIAGACQMSSFDVPEESRAAYHAAAAIASNFLVTLESSAEELLEAAGIENGRELLAPLTLRTAANWAERGPEALTGPISRGDEATVERHLDAIAERAPELEPLYRVLADRTRAIAAAGGLR